MERELVLVIAQLAEQAFAKIAAAYARRIKLANHFQGFLKIFYREVGSVDGALEQAGCGSGAGAAAAAAFPIA